jgi:hypothetical protein
MSRQWLRVHVLNFHTLSMAVCTRCLSRHIPGTVYVIVINHHIPGSVYVIILARRIHLHVAVNVDVSVHVKFSAYVVRIDVLFAI